MGARKYVLIFMLISLIIECFSIYLLVSNYPAYRISTIMVILIVHVIASILAAWPFESVYRTKRYLSLFVFVLLMTLSLAGYIIIIQFCYEVYFSKTPRLYEEYRQHILSGLEQSNSLPPFKDSYSYLRRNIDFESVYDSIKDDKDFPRKLKAIKTLGKIKNPDSIKALRVMLSDPHMDIRYYAGEEVASINEQYNIFINELKKELTRKPTDTQTYLETSNLLIDYAFSGFFELEEIKEKLEEARITLKRVLELDPALFEAHFLLGYIYLFNKEYGKAIDCYKKVLDIKNTFSLKGNDLSTLLGLTECYWQKKNLKEVDIYIKKIEEILIDYKGKDKELIINFIDTWSEVNV